MGVGWVVFVGGGGCVGAVVGSVVGAVGGSVPAPPQAEKRIWVEIIKIGRIFLIVFSLVSRYFLLIGVSHKLYYSIRNPSSNQVKSCSFDSCDRRFTFGAAYVYCLSIQTLGFLHAENFNNKNLLTLNCTYNIFWISNYE